MLDNRPPTQSSFVSGVFGRMLGQGTRTAGGGSNSAMDLGDRTSVGSTENSLSERLRNQSRAPQFRVESPRPRYWRTGAYVTYTGDGWTVRSDATTSLPAEPSVAPAARESLTQRIHLLRPARSLPAAWQPTAVRGLETDVRLTARGGLRAAEALPANTTYTVTSAVPPRDPARLQSAGTDYPPSLRDVYTQVPAATPDRVAAFTDRITADAGTPYETALAIERWLESNREYSLDATHGNGTVVSQFLFEMEAGYCEYFATSMVVMLRTQGIPARYAVGYSTGEQVGEDEYLVRAEHAHAWVEVYFPETGWVRFDPTPAPEQSADGSGSQAGGAPPEPSQSPSGTQLRLPQNRTDPVRDSSARDGTNRTASTGRNASGEGAGGQPPAREGGSGGERAAGPGYDISLVTDAVPGHAATVRVVRGSRPVQGVPVSFNGRPVGRTNRTGHVSGTVPFAERLVVNVTAAGAPGAALLASPGVAPRTDHNGTASATFAVPTTIAIAVDGETDPGATVTLRATIDGRPVPDARVAVNGSTVGRTGPDGELAVSLPVAETATVRVERGRAAGSRTISLADLQVDTTGFALPGLSVTATVTDAGTPVSGATVTVGGRTVETGPDGRATLALPVGTGATLTVETPAGLTRTVTVGYRYATAGFLVALALALAGGAAVLYRRRDGDSPIAPRVVAAARRLSRATLAALVALGATGERVRDEAPAAIGRALRALRGAAPSLERPSPPDVGALLARLRAAIEGLRPSPAPRRADASSPVPSRTDESADTAPDAAPDAETRVRETWREFRSGVPGGEAASRTPAEVGRAAIAAGYPRPAVERLRDAFRSVEYGRRDPLDALDEALAARRTLAGTAGPDAPTGGAAVTDGGAEQ